MKRFFLIISLAITFNLNATENRDQQDVIEKEIQTSIEKESQETIKKEFKKKVEDAIAQQAMTKFERIKIIMDEKKRLKNVSYRKKDDGQITLNKNYIRNTKYSNHVKALMRESSFYINFLIHEQDEESLKKESKNIAWNAICLSSILKADTQVIFNMLQITLYDEGSEEEVIFKKNNSKLVKIFSETNKNPTQEEIEIRCYEVYKKDDVDSKY